MFKRVIKTLITFTVLFVLVFVSGLVSALLFLLRTYLAKGLYADSPDIFWAVIITAILQAIAILFLDLCFKPII